MKKMNRLFALILSVILIMQFLPSFTVYAIGTTYYISYSTGNDNNNGTSTSTPWKTLAKINSHGSFSAGDQILLKCGDTWTGEELVPTGNGSTGNYITIASYGTGNKPLLTSPSADYDTRLAPNISPDPRDHIHVAIKLTDIGGWKIKDIEISNAEYGIITHNYQMGIRESVWFENLYIHNILGGRIFTSTDNPGALLYKSCGITVMGSNSPYNNVTLKNCDIRTTSCALKVHQTSDLQIDGGYFYDGQTEGIDLTMVTGGVIKNTRITHTGYPSGVWHGIAAVMFGNCRDLIMQDCEIDDVERGTVNYDGVAIDYEGNNTNITVLRCNIHDCDDSAFLIFNSCGDNSNNVNRIIDCNIYNCGKISGQPAFIRHYANTSSSGVLSGNNIKRYSSNQYINTIDGTSTDNMPQGYSVNNNTLYSSTSALPSVMTITSNSWVASSGFSGTNGSNQWYYQQWNGSNYSDITYDSGNSRWYGSEANLFVASNWQHPDANYDSVRKWTSPKAGRISISGTARMGASGGDGVNVSIWKNGTQIFSSTIAGSNTTGINTNVSAFDINPGDAVYFRVSKNATIYFDSTYWDPTITWTEKTSWTASTSFSNFQGYNQWSYEQWDGANYTFMDYDAANSRWVGSQSSCLTGGSWQHPDVNYESIRCWTAPKDGNITITASAYQSAGGGDGVYCSIKKNGTPYYNVIGKAATTLYGPTLINSTSPVSTNVGTTAVKEGDVIYFNIGRNNTLTNDGTLWDPTISYQ